MESRKVAPRGESGGRGTAIRGETQVRRRVHAGGSSSPLGRHSVAPETLVSFEINNKGKSVALDVDLPEIEDLRRKTASVPERGYKLTLKEIKGKALQELYARHVHAVGFRIAGEVFASLPTVEEVALSAYTQRPVPSTGHAVDTYVYSVRIQRHKWSQINFANLAVLDVVAAFEQFELRRKVGRGGQLEAIEPFAASAEELTGRSK